MECRKDRPRFYFVRDCTLSVRYGTVKKKSVTTFDSQRKHIMVILEGRARCWWITAKERRAFQTAQPKQDRCKTGFLTGRRLNLFSKTVFRILCVRGVPSDLATMSYHVGNANSLTSSFPHVASTNGFFQGCPRWGIVEKNTDRVSRRDDFCGTLVKSTEARYQTQFDVHFSIDINLLNCSEDLLCVSFIKDS